MGEKANISSEEQVGWLAWTLAQIADMSPERGITVDEFDAYFNGELEVENDFETAFGMAQILVRESLTPELRELAESTHTKSIRQAWLDHVARENGDV